MNRLIRRGGSWLLLVSVLISVFAGVSLQTAAISEVATNRNESDTNVIGIATFSESAKKYASYQDGSSTTTVLYEDLKEAAQANEFVHYYNDPSTLDTIRKITAAYSFTPAVSNDSELYCFKGTTYRGKISLGTNADGEAAWINSSDTVFDATYNDTMPNSDGSTGAAASGFGITGATYGYYLDKGESFYCLYTNTGTYSLHGEQTKTAVLMKVTMGDPHSCRRRSNYKFDEKFANLAKNTAYAEQVGIYGIGGAANVGYLGPDRLVAGKTPLLGVSCNYVDTYNVELTFLTNAAAEKFAKGLTEWSAYDLSSLTSQRIDVDGYLLFNDIDGMQGVELLDGFDGVHFHENANGAGSTYHFMNYVSPDTDLNPNSKGYFYATDLMGYNNTADEAAGLLDQITLGLYHGAIATYTGSTVTYCASMFRMDGKGVSVKNNTTATDGDYYYNSIAPDNEYNLPYHSWDENPYNPSSPAYQDTSRGYVEFLLTDKDGNSVPHTSASNSNATGILPYHGATGSGSVTFTALPITADPQIEKKVSLNAPTVSGSTVQMPSEDQMFSSLRMGDMNLGETNSSTLYYYVKALLPVCYGGDTYHSFSMSDTLEASLALKDSLADIKLYNYNHADAASGWKQVNDWSISMEGSTVTAAPNSVDQLIYDSEYVLVIPCKLTDARLTNPETVLEEIKNADADAAQRSTQTAAVQVTTSDAAEPTAQTAQQQTIADIVTAAPTDDYETDSYETDDYAADMTETASDATRAATSTQATTVPSYTVTFIDKKNGKTKLTKTIPGNEALTAKNTSGNAMKHYPDWEWKTSPTKTDDPLMLSNGDKLIGWQVYCPDDHMWLYHTWGGTDGKTGKAFWALPGQQPSRAYLYIVDNRQIFKLTNNVYDASTGKYVTKDRNGANIEIYAVWENNSSADKKIQSLEPNGGGKVRNLTTGAYSTEPVYLLGNVRQQADSQYVTSRSGYTFLGWRGLRRVFGLDTDTNKYTVANKEYGNNYWAWSKLFDAGKPTEYVKASYARLDGDPDWFDDITDRYYCVDRNDRYPEYPYVELYAAWAKADTTLTGFVPQGTDLRDANHTVTLSSDGVQGVFVSAKLTLSWAENGEVKTVTSDEQNIAGNLAEVTYELSEVFAGKTLWPASYEGNVTLSAAVKTYGLDSNSTKFTTVLNHTFRVGPEDTTLEDTHEATSESFVTELQPADGETTDDSTLSGGFFMLTADALQSALSSSGVTLAASEYDLSQLMYLTLKEAANGALYYTIESVDTGSILTVADGVPLWQAEANAADAGQQWHLEAAGEYRRYYLRNGADAYLSVTAQNGQYDLTTVSGEQTDDRVVMTLRGVGTAGNVAGISYQHGPDDPVIKTETDPVILHTQAEDYILYDYSTDISYTPRSALVKASDILLSDVMTTATENAPAKSVIYKKPDKKNTSIQIKLNSANAISRDDISASYKNTEDLQITYNDKPINLSYTAHLIPANNVHYEQYYLTYNTREKWSTNVEIPYEGVETIDDIQDGSPESHGYDNYYSKSYFADSNGMCCGTTVSAEDNNNWAEFTFTGTGFDIISKCSADSGTMCVGVFRVAEDGSEKRISTIICDTYLNSDYDYTQIPVVHKTGYEYGTYTVRIYAYYNALFDHQLTQKKSVLSETVLRELFDVGEEEELIYSSCADGIDLPTDSAAQPAAKRAVTASGGSYEVYIDAVRIYNPLGFTNTENGPLNPESSTFSPEAYRLYKQYGALDPEFIQVRSALVNSAASMEENSALYVAGEGTHSTDEIDISGAVYLSTSGNRYDYVIGTESADGKYYPVLTKDATPFYYNGTSISTESGDPLYVRKSGTDEEGNNTYAASFFYLSDGAYHKINAYGQYLFVDNVVEARGPENEVYLPKDSVIAFAISDYSPEQQVLISMKNAYKINNDGGYSVPLDIEVTVEINGKAFTLASGTEVYYNITDCIGSDGKVSIRTTKGTASICNIQVTGCTPTAGGETRRITAEGMEAFAYQALMDAQLEEHRREGHTWDSGTATEATCTEEGHVTYTCTVCNETRTESTDAALGHKWNEGTITLQPTQTETGTAVYTCVRCGEKSTQILPALAGEEKTDNTQGCDGGEKCASRRFNDTPASDNWAHEGIDYAIAHNLLRGVDENSFAPNDTMTRAMLVTVLYRLDGEPKATVSNPFTDVSGKAWYATAVAWAAENKIVNGIGKAMFEPDGKITREQTATILYRYTDYKKLAPQGAEFTEAFPDRSKISEYAVDAMRWANARGLLNGTTVGGIEYLDPQGDATRAQAAAILMRYMKNILGK